MGYLQYNSVHPPLDCVYWNGNDIFPFCRVSSVTFDLHFDLKSKTFNFRDTCSVKTLSFPFHVPNRTLRNAHSRKLRRLPFDHLVHHNSALKGSGTDSWRIAFDERFFPGVSPAYPTRDRQSPNSYSGFGGIINFWLFLILCKLSSSIYFYKIFLNACGHVRIEALAFSNAYSTDSSLDLLPFRTSLHPAAVVINLSIVFLLKEQLFFLGKPVIHYILIQIPQLWVISALLRSIGIGSDSWVYKGRT